MRLNPRLRFEEDGSCTMAGVPAPDMMGILLAASKHLTHELLNRDRSQPVDPDNKAYRQAMYDINGAVTRGLAFFIADKLEDWHDEGPVSLRRGAGDEISIKAKAGNNFRSWLTCAQLGIYMKYPTEAKKSWVAEDRRLMGILNTLDRSSDRRPYNRYTYVDIPYGELDSFGRRRRLEAAKSDARLRVVINEIIADKCQSKSSPSPSSSTG